MIRRTFLALTASVALFSAPAFAESHAMDIVDTAVAAGSCRRETGRRALCAMDTSVEPLRTLRISSSRALIRDSYLQIVVFGAPAPQRAAPFL